MADLVTVEQVQVRMGRTFAGDELAQVQALITDASALAVQLVNDADTTDAWDAGTVGTVPDAVVPAVVGMVRRSLDNPHGFTSERSFEYSYAGASSEGVFATSAEARAIRRAAGAVGVTTVHLSAPTPPHSGEGVYVPDAGAAGAYVEVLAGEDWLEGSWH